VWLQEIGISIFGLIGYNQGGTSSSSVVPMLHLYSTKESVPMVKKYVLHPSNNFSCQSVVTLAGVYEISVIHIFNTQDFVGCLGDGQNQAEYPKPSSRMVFTMTELTAVHPSIAAPFPWRSPWVGMSTCKGVGSISLFRSAKGSAYMMG
jgi:hypothetical protein